MKGELIVFTLFLNCLSFVSPSAERLEAIEVVKIESVPFAVIVFCNRNQFFCTGTIVHAQWVLTSAHCLYNEDGDFTENDCSVTVIAGTSSVNNSMKDVTAGTAQRRQSVKLEVHVSYTWAENFIHDLALIKLEKPFEMTDRVNVAPLYGLGNHSRHSPSVLDMESAATFMCVGYGFGKVRRSTVNGNDGALKIQQYQVGKHCHCMEKVRSKRSPYNVLRKRNTWICDEVEGFAGVCVGDNGGQLICDDKLRGVATALFHYQIQDTCTLWEDLQKNECGDKNTLNVFTDLCFYSQWLHTLVPKIPVTDDSCRPSNIKISGRHVFYDSTEDH